MARQARVLPTSDHGNAPRSGARPRTADRAEAAPHGQGTPTSGRHARERETCADDAAPYQREFRAASHPGWHDRLPLPRLRPGGRGDAPNVVVPRPRIPNGSDPQTWDVRFSHVLSTNSEFHLMAERFRDLMLERTGGRFRVVIYPSGQLGGERMAFEQIQAGAVHLAITGTPVLSGWVPEGQMFDLPFLFETRDHGLSVMNGPVGDWWRDLLLGRTGVRSLGFLDYGFRHVYNRRRPVEAPEDLAGLKLRVLQNATYLAAYSALGVQATPMNYGEVYSALQQGVIDGGEANAIGFVSSRLYEVARFYSFTSITYNPITLLVNEPFYRALPPDIRETVDRSVDGRARLPERCRASDGGRRAGANARERRRRSPARTWRRSLPP